MNSRVCPSCKHDVYDDMAGKCPFCGARLRKGFRAATPGNQVKNVRIVLIIASLVLMLAGGMVTFLLAGSEERNIQQSRIQSHTAEPTPCIDNMEVILRAQREFMEEYGRFAADAKGLSGHTIGLELHCPQTGETYEMTVQGDVVRLVCPTHGTRTI